MNNNNLIQYNKNYTEEEKHNIVIKAQKKAVESRKTRKLLREELEEQLLKDNKQSLIVKGLIDKAVKGDIRAFEIIRDTLGERLKDGTLKDKRENRRTFCVAPGELEELKKLNVIKEYDNIIINDLPYEE